MVFLYPDGLKTTKIMIYEEFCYKGIGKIGKEALRMNCQKTKQMFIQSTSIMRLPCKNIVSQSGDHKST